MILGGAISRDRGPVWGELTRAQNGQAISNLARAFHLPRSQAKTAILEMLPPLKRGLDQQTLSRGALARLIELLGKNDYVAVLESPALMGATSTQVIGNDALTALAGRDESAQIAGRAAAAAGISQMIAEYLLPVVAALFMGALAARTRAAILALARNDDPSAPSVAASAPAPLLPVGRGSSGVFAGSTVLAPNDTNAVREILYRELAERIRSGGNSPGDPLHAARQIMAEGLGVRPRHAPWLARLQQGALTTLRDAGAMAQQRLDGLRRRLRSRD